MIDFLGIGTQKPGTTWLMKNLKTHPGAWTLRLIKELHYFDVLYLGQSKTTQLNRVRRRIERTVDKAPWKNDRSQEKHAYYRKIHDPEFAITDAWYEHVFSRALGKG